MKNSFQELIPIVELIEVQQREKYAELAKQISQVEEELSELRAQYAEPDTTHALAIGQRGVWNAWLQQEIQSMLLRQANSLAAKERQAIELKTAIGRADVVRKLARKNDGSR
ncbi:MAG: hypothetical protein ACSHXD_01475 [Marinosulfonomonas sp.]